MADATLIKVSSKGLVTLPKKIRTRLGIEEGDFNSADDTNYVLLIFPSDLIVIHREFFPL